jgi:hypothetical protein
MCQRFVTAAAERDNRDKGKSTGPCCGGVAVIPINDDVTPGNSDNRAKVGGAMVPANAVANFEFSRLVAGQ